MLLGKRRQGAVVEKIDKALRMILEAVTAKYKKSTCYLLLARLSGPSTLLQISTGVDSELISTIA